MCFDPVSLGLTAAGAAASVIGGGQQREAMQKQQSQELQQNLAVQAARNAEVQALMRKEEAAAASNKLLVDNAVANADPAHVAAAQQKATTDRTGAANGLIDMIPQNAVPLGNDAPGAIQAEYDKRRGAATGVARQGAAANANYSSFGDALNGINLGSADAARGVNTTNAIARGDASILPYDQQYAEQMARDTNLVQPYDTTGNTISGLGNLFATLGGSGKGGQFAASLGSGFK